MNIIESLKQFLDKDILKRFSDNIQTRIKDPEYGKLIIILGQKGTGKSETIKHLCRELSGYKFVVRLDNNLNPLPMHINDKQDYQKIKDCTVIENGHITWEEGLFIIEDYPYLRSSAESTLYSLLANARHYRMNFILIAHQYSVINKKIFDFANYILLYKDAVITAHQLNRKVGGLGNGHAVIRGLNNLKKYNYYLISCDHKKWHNPSLNSRKVKPLRRAVRGWLKETELTDIDYPKKSISPPITN
jgi:hypothetical protein